MKLHNVDSQSQSSGVGALDHSAMSASSVVLSENYHVLHSSARQYLGVGAMQAATIAAAVGHSPSPLASSGDDQLRVPGLGPLPSSLSPSLLFPLTPLLFVPPSSSSSSSSPSALRHPPSGSSSFDAILSHPSALSVPSDSFSYSYSFPPPTPLTPSPSFTPSLSSASFPSSSLVTPSLPPSISYLLPNPSSSQFLSSSSSSSSFYPPVSSSSSSSLLSSVPPPPGFPPLFLCSLGLFFLCSSSVSFRFLLFLFSPSYHSSSSSYCFRFFLFLFWFLALFSPGGPPGAICWVFQLIINHLLVGF